MNPSPLDLALRSSHAGRRPARLRSLAEFDREGSEPEAAFPEKEESQQPQMSAALELVDRAAMTIKALQERADQVEALARSLLERTRSEMEDIKVEIEECRQRAQLAEARAEEAERSLARAEGKAQDADMIATDCYRGLSAFCDAVVTRLAPACAALERLQSEEDLLKTG